MAEPYLTALRELVQRVVVEPGDLSRVECKHFFGGAAAYSQERIFMSLTSVGLGLKLPEEARATMKNQGAMPLRYFPRAPIKKGYVVVPPLIADDPVALAPWVSVSIAGLVVD